MKKKRATKGKGRRRTIRKAARVQKPTAALIAGHRLYRIRADGDGQSFWDVTDELLLDLDDVRDLAPECSKADFCALVASLPKAESARGEVEPEKPNPYNNLGFDVLALFARAEQRGHCFVTARVSSEFNFGIAVERALSVKQVLRKGMEAAEDQQAQADE